jgi:hypothetical protein
MQNIKKNITIKVSMTILFKHQKKSIKQTYDFIKKNLCLVK